MDYRSTTAQGVSQVSSLLEASPGPSERLVRPVAEWPGLGVLALTQRHFLFFIQNKLERLKPGSLM